MKKLNKNLKQVVDHVNNHLRLEKCIDGKNSLVQWLKAFLLSNRVIPEAGYFYTTDEYYDPLDGRVWKGEPHLERCGKEKAEFIQFINE